MERRPELELRPGLTSATLFRYPACMFARSFRRDSYYRSHT